jgi:dihydropteroate synthase
MIWHCGNFDFDTQTPIIMGILNVTPDSFSDGGCYVELDVALAHAHEMCEQGARIIDVGGESTRPGSGEVPPDEEWARIGDVVRALAEEGVCVSVDTRHALVAERAVAAGAAIINDVSGFRDSEMQRVARECDAGLVVMHMQGTPDVMQTQTDTYDDVVADVCDYLQQRTILLESQGIARNRICIDPGPGFGKTPKQTIELMRNIQEFVHLGYPVMVAASRKSYVTAAYHLDNPDLDTRDTASAAEALLACELGASVVRVHNVAKTAAALKDLRPYVFLGLGSNVALVGADDEVTEGKIAQINMALGQLCQLPDTLIVDVAPFYISRAAYKEDQDDFVNTVVLLRTGIAPKELLAYLHQIEAQLGRVRTEENGPRTIDLDILDYQFYNYSTPDLTLPHPRVCERDFVVKPLSAIMPGHVLADGTPVESVLESERLGAAVPVLSGAH